jgi:4-amino-4-deoxy-L-arabinose transferase-like glycosyltransferase
MIWRRFDWNSWFIIVASAVTVSVVVPCFVVPCFVVPFFVVRLDVARRRPRAARRSSIAGVVAAMGALLLAPTMWTLGSLRAGVSGPLPFAQPERNTVSSSTGNQITPNGGFQFPSISVPSLTAYLREHRAGERWDLAVQSAGPAEELIISSGESVMAIGGFVGSDPIETAGRLRQRVRDGELRYFLLATRVGGGLIPGLFGLGDTTAWVGDRCPVVSTDVWEHGAVEDTAKPGTQAFPGGPTAAAFQLYDCKGFS